MATAKVSGLGDNLYYAGYDLSGDILSVDTMSGGPALLDVTALKQSAHNRIGGQRQGSWSLTSAFENAGATVAPGVPLSGNPVTSTFNWFVLVTVVGGTGTQVSINGVNQGTFDGTYVLPPLGTIILTYSVAPTWTWTAVGTEHNALSPLLRTDQSAMYARGAVLGNPAACMTAKQVNYDPTRNTDGALTAKIDLIANGFGYEWGNLVTAGLRTDLVATSPGSGFDFGNGFVTPAVPASNVNATNTSPLPAVVTLTGFTLTAVTVNGVIVGSTNAAYTVPVGGTINVTYTVAGTWTWVLQTVFGAQAYLQLCDIVGTSVDVAVQGAPDNTTWAAIAGLDFGAQAAIGSFRAATAAGVTIPRYIRCISTGTFTLATFAVALVRNIQVAQF